jgi:hypothetical protein
LCDSIVCMAEPNIWDDAWGEQSPRVGGAPDPRRRRTKGAGMSERDESTTTTLELLLSEPEVVAWLADYRPVPDDAPDDDAPQAA